MADNARGIHVSPGIYTREIDMQYATKSLGITTLGLVGETLKGPAFQPMEIANWREFTSMFGGTSTEKFRGSQYPKYELPYIAKSYLTESEQLNVVRVLGLSGYNAGPAWAITVEKSGDTKGKKYIVAILRSRGTYKAYDKIFKGNDNCACETANYDTLNYYVGEKNAYTDCKKKGYNDVLDIQNYKPLIDKGDECNGYSMSPGDGNMSISAVNRGRFKIVGLTGRQSDGSDKNSIEKGGDGYFEYSLSFNPFDKEYILDVLGTTPDDGDAPIYVESLFDVALDQMILDGKVDQISSSLTFYNVGYIADYCHHEPVDGIVTIPQEMLRRKNVGERYLAAGSDVEDNIYAVPYDFHTKKPYMYADYAKTGDTGSTDVVNHCPIPSNDSDYQEKYDEWANSNVPYVKLKPGQIYTVKQYTLPSGKRSYLYAYYEPDTLEGAKLSDDEKIAAYGNLKNGGYSGNTAETSTAVFNYADGLYYRMVNKSANTGSTDYKLDYISLDLNDYKSAYRYASTPWIVSNLKGDMGNVEVNRMFRFHTISDGNSSNYEVKVSIENLRPDDGVFDVVVRRIDDVDDSIIPLEKFGRCSMVPGDSNYIAYKIGSFDGVYESKSRYITVEVNETTAAKLSTPCGFLGYPLPDYSGAAISDDSNTNHSNVAFPDLKYNRFYDEDVKNRRQYFGLSSWVGVDVDTFTFKGNTAYIDDPKFRTHGFHLDSRLDHNHGGIDPSAVTVDGESGYIFDSVDTNSRTATLPRTPVIGTEAEMEGSIFENVNLRKFTVYFYGGFDGWDPYRDQRTNGDKFKYSQYRGYVNTASGEGYAFNRLRNPDLLGINENGITSDYYAYLSGIRQFANPESVDINVFATPGIDYVNQKLLVGEAIDMIEEDRADSIYVVTTPDKPSGTSDFIDDMYTPYDAVANLDDSEIDSNYTCTYYPWVKYLDTTNNQYIFLPPTKDVVRNFAQTDNASWPWFAPAGIDRGSVDCVRARYITRLADEDMLYDGRINPIKTFSREGCKVWGQKNLQINESQLNRIAVRRLLLRVRKLIAIACIGLIFEPNDDSTKKSFISTVTPILDSIRSNRGLSDYKVEVDDSQEARDRRELPAKIFLKVWNALEYITIDFILTPQGVNFSDI